ncbi:MAG TPA: prolyl oligopeptidase family serine peptidase, partial [Planctomycetota bacterium]|nr:prolyl oligopeptidase family serine peptidase [Planctomycetota bacterium]
LLRAGPNALYVTGARGAFALELTRPAAPLLLGAHDLTLPDAVVGEDELLLAAVPVTNASAMALEGVELGVLRNEHFAATSIEVGRLEPLQTLKVPLRVEFANRSATAMPGELVLELAATAEAILADIRVTARVRVQPFGAPRLATFESALDGSVQEYGILPPTREGLAEDELAGLVLSLHGAGVGARSQIEAYSPKPDLWIAAPTNRRPYGFDWQDWGRCDAYEVRDQAQWNARHGASSIDPARVYLTGHSMGGHGTWHLAANDPFAWAAIAPSAGWQSFDTYGGRPDGLLRELWHLADGPSDTLALVENLAQVPTYILHGAADDNVPASEAHAMEVALRAAGAVDLRVHYQEDAGHWWDGDAAPGADCVDWQGIFDLFGERRGRPSSTASAPVFWPDGHPLQTEPGWRHTLTTWDRPGRLGPFAVFPERGAPARIAAWVEDLVPAGAGYRARVQLELAAGLSVHRSYGLPGSVSQVTLEPAGPEFEVPYSRRGGFPTVGARRTAEGWEFLGEGGVDGTVGHASRLRGIKRVFDRRFVLVVGTIGTAEEDEALLERALHDSQAWWYRGNGRAEVWRDHEVGEQRGSDRNVILYGNADTNCAWDRFVPSDASLRVTRGRLELGVRVAEGDDLCAVAVMPQAGWREHAGDPALGDRVPLVGLFADTGVAGTRLHPLGAHFVSGVGIPDLVVWSSTVLREGDGGVLAAGWLGADL